MRKIVVTSNCQTGGIALSLKAMLPEFEIIPLPITRFNNKNEVESSVALLNKLKSSDIWVTINSGIKLNCSSKIINIPKIQFRAFHPDLSYAYSRQTNKLTNIHYNSFIGIWAYNNNIDPSDASKLYNFSIYKQLGYFNNWDKSISQLRKNFLENGFTSAEFESFFLAVKRKGLFMHSVNHPNIQTIIEFGKLIALRISGKKSLISRNIFLVDGLAQNTIWPLYIEVGQELGLSGDYCWRINGEELDGVNLYLEYTFRNYRANGIEPGDLVSHNSISNVDQIFNKGLI